MAGYFTFVDTTSTQVTGTPLPTGTPTTIRTWTNWDCLTGISYITAADGRRFTVETPPNCPTDGSGFTTVYVYAQVSTGVHTYYYEQSSAAAEASLIVPITSTVLATPTASTDAAEQPANVPYLRSSNKPVGFIVGITVGCVIAAFVLAIVARACWRCARKWKLKKEGLLAARPAEKGIDGLRQFYNPAAVAAETSTAPQQAEFYAPRGLVAAATAGGARDAGRNPMSVSGGQTPNPAVVQAGPSNRKSVGSPMLPSTAEVAEDNELYEPPRAVGGAEGKGKEPVRRPQSPTPQLPSRGTDPDEIGTVKDVGGKLA